MRRIQKILQLFILAALWLILLAVVRPDNIVAQIILTTGWIILGWLAGFFAQEEFSDWLWGFSQIIKGLVKVKDTSAAIHRVDHISVPISPDELRRLENIARPRL